MLTQQSMICRKYHGKTSYILRNSHAGIGEFVGMGYHVDNMQMMETIESQLMTTWKSHKTIAQINCTNESHKSIMQDKMMSHQRMEMMNDAFGCSRATQECMEDLRLVNLIARHPSRRDEQVKVPC